jgi:hypothetical protein
MSGPARPLSSVAAHRPSALRPAVWKEQACLLPCRQRRSKSSPRNNSTLHTSSSTIVGSGSRRYPETCTPKPNRRPRRPGQRPWRPLTRFDETSLGPPIPKEKLGISYIGTSVKAKPRRSQKSSPFAARPNRSVANNRASGTAYTNLANLLPSAIILRKIFHKLPSQRRGFPENSSHHALKPSDSRPSPWQNRPFSEILRGNVGQVSNLSADI